MNDPAGFFSYLPDLDRDWAACLAVARTASGPLNGRRAQARPSAPGRAKPLVDPQRFFLILPAIEINQQQVNGRRNREISHALYCGSGMPPVSILPPLPKDRFCRDRLSETGLAETLTASGPLPGANIANRTPHCWSFSDLGLAPRQRSSHRLLDVAPSDHFPIGTIVQRS